ncbi:hypothetical protein ACPOL_3764 [Acidisarcina polymorpha]|uniref:Uncharacterized protein n=1 Tax=Acidisarcina polymorpha TaxID=2211140 RepID=A0A2Z5G1I6_9BACT|nr:hypothetical protein ACPOL_3764 [Acidisarcina polymorpha]
MLNGKEPRFGGRKFQGLFCIWDGSLAVFQASPQDSCPPMRR